ncbi:MAG: MarR family transcriptional regulator [Alphaproteobacteria bacterium]|nr:MAG: MarR family transcriptional regulator [Alphaproteobacteria bacterium]
MAHIIAEYCLLSNIFLQQYDIIRFIHLYRGCSVKKKELSYGMLDRMVGLELRKAQMLARQTFLDLLKGHILPGHFTILVLIANNPGQSQSRIAEAAGFDRSTLVPVLKQFEKDGLIERVAARNDRRSKTMTITAKGKKLIKKFNDDIKRLEDRLVEGLGQEKHAQLSDLLIQFQHLLQSWTKKDGD